MACLRSPGLIGATRSEYHGSTAPRPLGALYQASRSTGHPQQCDHRELDSDRRLFAGARRAAADANLDPARRAMAGRRDTRGNAAEYHAYSVTARDHRLLDHAVVLRDGSDRNAGATRI